MRLLIINNLASGFGEGSIYDFMRSIIRDGDEVVMRATDGTTDFRTFLTDAKEFDAVVAAGGDGTVATVGYLLANTGIPLLPFPSGTANLLAQNLCSPIEPHALAQLLKNGKILDFDLGEITVNNNRYGFGVMSGCGYDSIIMENANPNKRLLGPLAYFSAAFTNTNVQTSQITLNLDGQTIETEGFGILIINFSKIQFDISITHNNLPRDGELDVAILKGKNALELLPALISAMLDRDQSFPERGSSIEFYSAKEISIVADPPMEMQYDGEVTHQTTPFYARVLPHAVRFIISDEGYDMYCDHE